MSDNLNSTHIMTAVNFLSQAQPPRLPPTVLSLTAFSSPAVAPIKFSTNPASQNSMPTVPHHEAKNGKSNPQFKGPKKHR